MRPFCSSLRRVRSSVILVCALPCACATLAGQQPSLQVTVDESSGSYVLGSGSIKSVLEANSAAKVDNKWLKPAAYPHHTVTRSTSELALGAASDWTIRYSGLANEPDLLVQIRTYKDVPFGELTVKVVNTGSRPIEVQAIRPLQATGSILNLGGPASADRVLSDSFSEDRPAMQIRDLSNAEHQVHRAVGSQLIFNRQSHLSWFVGTLTSDKFLTVLRLHTSASDPSRITSYDIDSTGTTELLLENSLMTSPPEDRMDLSVAVPPGSELSSERLLFSISNDYHQQLETYAHLIRDLHHARVTAPTPLGWWSWTAYYFGLNEDTALTNAQWLSQHLRQFGYTFFHIDEGYQFARGEYATPDANLFPQGMAALEHRILNQGLTPGIWTAPFEVSERSWIFAHHQDWLVHNARGEPIHIGVVTDNKDHLYALDATNPGAQSYLRTTYRTLTQVWGVRYIKMDFMEDSAVEGVHFQAGTTALEAQRIGLQVIRDAVGPQVLLDKDGCELLNPVGIVDMGRISQDTGHTFSSSRDAAPGIAARYYMNRNYFLADPDAFTVSRQTVDDQEWHGASVALTLDEAKVSIALSAVSGGLFEDGDDLPTLQESPERVALLENITLLDMARLGRSSTPIDLMSYKPEDLQPSLFVLREDPRQTIFTIFNWTEQPRTHSVTPGELGLAPGASYTVSDALDSESHPRPFGTAMDVTQPAHSVRLLKIVNESLPPHVPAAKATLPATGAVGAALTFVADPATPDDSLVQYTWDFGDGVTADGRQQSHAYTHPGSFPVVLTVTGLDRTTGRSNYTVNVTGAMSTRFHPENGRRPQPDSQ